MTYYVRYALTAPAPITVLEINQGLQQLDADLAIDADLLIFKEEEYGQVNIVSAGDDFFEDELELMTGFAEQNENSTFLVAALSKAISIVLLQVFWSGRDEGIVKHVINTMFDRMMQNRAGLLMDEDGSYYYNLAGPAAAS